MCGLTGTTGGSPVEGMCDCFLARDSCKLKDLS